MSRKFTIKLSLIYCSTFKCIWWINKVAFVHSKHFVQDKYSFEKSKKMNANNYKLWLNSQCLFCSRNSQVPSLVSKIIYHFTRFIFSFSVHSRLAINRSDFNAFLWQLSFDFNFDHSTFMQNSFEIHLLFSVNLLEFPLLPMKHLLITLK